MSDDKSLGDKFVEGAVLGSMAAGAALGYSTGSENLQGFADGASAYSQRDESSDALDQASYESGQTGTSQSA